MDAVILNYRAGKLQQFASAMRDRFTAVKGKYEIVFTGDDWKEESVNVFRGNGRGWDLRKGTVQRPTLTVSPFCLASRCHSAKRASSSLK